MLVQNSPSLILSNLSSRNTKVIEGPGLVTSLSFANLTNPLQPGNESASELLNQLSMDTLRTRGIVWPL
jgi:hypothetical protein